MDSVKITREYIVVRVSKRRFSVGFRLIFEGRKESEAQNSYMLYSEKYTSAWAAAASIIDLKDSDAFRPGSAPSRSRGEFGDGHDTLEAIQRRIKLHSK